MKKTRKLVKIIYTLTVISALATLAVFFYPTISDGWNSYVAGKRITEYVTNQTQEKDYSQVIEAADRYNKELLSEGSNNIANYAFKLSGDENNPNADLTGEVLHPDEYYESQLDLLQNGMMGYIDISSIDVSLPIFHYTSEEVLAKGVGHLYGTSLPVGGKGTHSVLTGHSGLMTARLFTDLEKLTVGDQFTIHTAGLELNYEIDQIETVLPQEMELLGINPDEDLVTLVTCTPYGINSHRLLVRGHRIADTQVSEEEARYVTEAETASRFPVKIFIFTGLALLIGIVVIIMIWRKE